jgi:hypothetical protein
MASPLPRLDTSRLLLLGACQEPRLRDTGGRPRTTFGQNTAASDVFRETPGVFERVRQSFVRRCNACIECGGRHFEHLL